MARSNTTGNVSFQGHMQHLRRTNNIRSLSRQKGTQYGHRKRERRKGEKLARQESKARGSLGVDDYYSKLRCISDESSRCRGTPPNETLFDDASTSFTGRAAAESGADGAGLGTGTNGATSTTAFSSTCLSFRDRDENSRGDSDPRGSHLYAVFKYRMNRLRQNVRASAAVVQVIVQ